MKTKKYVYGRALAWLCTGALLFAAVSCADDDNGDSEPNNEWHDQNDKDKDCDSGDNNHDTTTQAYEVGTMVEIDGKQWFVIKNTETPEKVAAESAEHHYYPNKAADEYRDLLIKKHGISEPYVLVFKETPLNMTETYRDDDYRILCDGKHCYQIMYRWYYNQMDSEVSSTITIDALRMEYDPSVFVIKTLSAAHGSDVSKKFHYRYDFKYDQGEGKTISYEDSNLKSIYGENSFVYINGKEYSQYITQDRTNEVDYFSYVLCNPRSSFGQFFEFRTYPLMTEKPDYCGLITYTKGLVDDVSKNDYRVDLRINELRYTSADTYVVNFTVKTTTPPAQESSQRFSSLTADGADKYVTVSEETTTCNNMTVPAEITFTTHFAYEDSKLDDFTAITFVPDAQDDYVVYVPKKGEKNPYDFIDKFKEAYYSIFDTSAATSN